MRELGSLLTAWGTRQVLSPGSHLPESSGYTQSWDIYLVTHTPVWILGTCGIAPRDVLGDKACGPVKEKLPHSETSIRASIAWRHTQGSLPPCHSTTGKTAQLLRVDQKANPPSSGWTKATNVQNEGKWVVSLMLDHTKGISGLPEKVRMKTQEVGVVVLPMGLQTPSAPLVLSPTPPIGTLF